MAIQSLILVALALVLGARFEGGIGGVAIMIAVSTLLGAGFGGISMGTALTVRQRESVIGMNQLLVLPGVFLSTAFMPAALLPGWMATVAQFNPVNWAVVASHEAMLASQPDWTIVMVRTGLLALFSIATGLLGTISFRSYQRSS